MPVHPLRIVPSDLDTPPPALMQLDLGARLRELRTERGWSLDEAALMIGLSRSSLYKIEKGKMSPTFEALRKLSEGFGLDLQRLLGSPSGMRAAGRRAITRADSKPDYAIQHYTYRPLAEALAHKAMLPFEFIVHARSLDAFADWDRHDTEDFCYVLKGTMVLYTEFYEPVTLKTGDSIYYDGRMGHACISTGAGDATVLWVSSV